MAWGRREIEAGMTKITYLAMMGWKWKVSVV